MYTNDDLSLSLNNSSYGAIDFKDIAFRPDDFIKSEIVLNIILNRSIKDLDELLYYLECYKFVEQSSLVEALNGKISLYLRREERVRYIFEPKYRLPSPEFPDLLIYGLVFNGKDDEGKVEVFYNVFAGYNKKELEHRYPDIIFKYVPVLPGTFDIMAYDLDDLYERYSAYDVFLRLVYEGYKLGASELFLDMYYVDLIPHYRAKFRIGLPIVECHLFKMTRKLIGRISESVSEKLKTRDNDMLTAGGQEGALTNVLMSNNLTLRVMQMNACDDGVYASFRFHTDRALKLKVNELGLDSRTLDDLRYFAKKRDGLTLIVGQTNTGKNTTINSFVSEMSKEPINILEIASRVEIKSNWCVTEYGDKGDDLLAKAKSMKKGNADVVILTEIPSPDIAKGVLDLINTGLHVITTMHVSRLWEVPQKLKQLVGDDYLIMMSLLNGIVNQKAFSRNCDHCTTVKAIDLERIQNNPRLFEFCKKYNITKIAFHDEKSSKECPYCNNGKMPGIIPIAESIVFDRDFKRHLLMCTNYIEMSILLEDYLFKNKLALEYKIAEKVNRGEIDFDSINRVL